MDFFFTGSNLRKKQEKKSELNLPYEWVHRPFHSNRQVHWGLPYRKLYLPLPEFHLFKHKDWIGFPLE